MRGLETYRKKRNPSSTPEPFGGTAPSMAGGPQAPHLYVVQQHDATRMHWDVRLEIDGVLVSFAVPKGPSLDPNEKRLAVQTEDHPIDYRVFEGIIPDGNYGAGAMILWDTGTFHSFEPVDPVEGLAMGKLDLVFSGMKMRGRWKLIRTKGEGDKNWLMIRVEKGAVPKEELVVTHAASIVSGLTIVELDKRVRRDEDLRKRALALGAEERTVDARTIEPMLASSKETPFSHPAWVFEQKYDGWRLLAQKERGGRVRAYTRRGRDVTDLVPEIARAAAHLPVESLVLDGEVVAPDARGIASFERIQRRMLGGEAGLKQELEIPLQMHAFDLLEVSGVDVMRLPLVERKALLQRLVPRVGFIGYADHVENEGEALFESARNAGLEGIMAKRASAPYTPGKRSTDWVKIKAPVTHECVVVGWTRVKSGDNDLGALMLGWHVDGKLTYAGLVGTGFDQELRSSLLKRMAPLAEKKKLFEGEPGPLVKNPTYVRPELVVRVRFRDVTSVGVIRHSSFVDVVEGREIAHVTAPISHAEPEEPPPPVEKSEPPPIKLVNVDKTFWPRDGYTKGDLLEYYEAVWPWLAPYLRDRPLVLTRYPDGIDGKNFFQKNAPPFTPSWVATHHIGDTDFFLCNDLRTLLYVVNLGAIPLHIWSSRRTSLSRPDWTILDLDPKGAPFAHVVKVAQHIHALLDELKAPHYVKTSGQDGLHILIPLGAELDHDEARALAEVLAKVTAQELPDICTVARNLQAREGRVYVDYLQNGEGKTIASFYSARPRDGAPVSMTLDWDELDGKLRPAAFTIKTAIKRLKRVGDPAVQVLDGKQDVLELLSRLGARLRG